MEEAAAREKRRMRFTVREMMLVMAIIALAFGWYRSEREANAESRRLQQRLLGLRLQSQTGPFRDEANRDEGQTRIPSTTRVLSGIDLKRASLRGVSLSAGRQPAFQSTIFKECDLENATLTAGVSSFQRAQFDEANLAGVTLTGSGSSFQLATFDDADLTAAQLEGNFQASSFVCARLVRATLKGGGTAFQGASFAGADLSGAKLIGGGASFQSVDIDGARFVGADLTGLEARNLASCHFETPPTYDEATKFPAGFDPKLEGWNRVE
jgi:uncharacterized protein YjbI with pentapeptide repeats